MKKIIILFSLLVIIMLFPTFISNVYAPPGPPPHGSPIDIGSLFLLISGLLFGIGRIIVKSRK